MGDVYTPVGFFQRVFTIILALALGEAFKQFVADRAENSVDRVIHWSRLPALVSVFLLIIPFFQGMSIYLYNVYGDLSKLQSTYPVDLLIDSTVFALDSAIFFAMSRMLSSSIWSRFAKTVIVLLTLDAGWVIARHNNLPDIKLWLWQDLGMLAGLAAVLFAFRGARYHVAAPNRPPLWPSLCVMLIVIAKTGTDYWAFWNQYFIPIQHLTKAAR